MKINYDKLADAAYFTFKKGEIFKTVTIDNSVNIDVAEDGSVIGVEILSASTGKGKKLQVVVGQTSTHQNVTCQTLKSFVLAHK